MLSIYSNYYSFWNTGNPHLYIWKNGAVSYESFNANLIFKPYLKFVFFIKLFSSYLLLLFLWYIILILILIIWGAQL